MNELYCFYNGLILYYEPLSEHVGFVSGTKPISQGKLTLNVDIPIIGSLGDVKAFNKEFRDNKKLQL